MSPPRIASLATAVPSHVLDTPQVVIEAAKIFGRFGDEYNRMAGVFSNAGINRRYSVCPTEWFHTESNWPDRSSRFLEGATALFREVAAKALEEAELEASAIDAIVMVSSTGIATPSIEAHVMHKMGFRDDVTSGLDDHGKVARYTARGVGIIRGYGRLAGPGRVDVDRRVYTTPRVVIATGSVTAPRRSRAWRRRDTGPTARRWRFARSPNAPQCWAAGRWASSWGRCCRATAVGCA